jgi:hypothetical protein
MRDGNLICRQQRAENNSHSLLILKRLYFKQTGWKFNFADMKLVSLTQFKQ